MSSLPASTRADHGRRHSRFPIEGAVRIYSGSAMWQSQLIDLAIRGALVSRPLGFDGRIGNRYRLDVRLEGGPMIAMAVSLARLDNVAAGFSCERIDLDSFLRLKRTIELNLGNAELLNRELSALGVT
ncbi:PilZ domain-containing protein [Aquimonas voraii]|uniref:PilZ domain-containing protein n=1 Tax=Aquimonas voraii TaxID=265719 RepID=A0A1G6YYQ8_9GAMM|nr:PilZ domain-containing protein [Aquimonas voraii]SDD95451.1 PilZ domain-containing protein [Aquimonas voraii]